MKIKYFTAISIVVFFALYIYSASLFPGGSSVEAQHIGFDWVHNYWCDLLASFTVNNVYNTGHYFAQAAMIVLAIGLIYFAINISHWIRMSKKVSNSIKIGVIVAMVAVQFVSGKYHGTVLIISGLSGLVGLVGTIYGLRMNGYRYLSYAGIFCLVLLILNNLIYFSKIGIEILALLQKISFLIVLLWIALVDIVLEKNPPHQYVSFEVIESP